MSKKLKISIIGSRGYPYVYSGYETLVKELSERLVKSGIDVTVYCHRKLFKKRPKKVNGVNLIYTPSVNSKILSQLYNSFFSFIHVCFSNADVVLVVNSANGPFGLLTKIFRKKTCINVDGLEWLRPKWKGLGSIYFRIASKLSTILFDQIITDSVEMNRIYKKYFKNYSTVISYGPSMINSANKSVLSKFKLLEKNYYLIVGRLIPDNNSMLIIKGFVKSSSKKKLVIVGDVPYSDKYADDVKSFKSHDNIIFTGYIKNQNELSCLYKYCYGYFHGHEFGGTNPTMINALSFNCQILALNTIFNTEMLRGYKSTIFEKNEISVKESIQFFEKNYKKIRAYNKDYKLLKEYDWEYITKSYLTIFLKIKNGIKF